MNIHLPGVVITMFKLPAPVQEKSSPGRGVGAILTNMHPMGFRCHIRVKVVQICTVVQSHILGFAHNFLLVKLMKVSIAN
jgi:hypothetical protein